MLCTLWQTKSTATMQYRYRMELVRRFVVPQPGMWELLDSTCTLGHHSTFDSRYIRDLAMPLEAKTILVSASMLQATKYMSARQYTCSDRIAHYTIVMSRRMK